MKASIPGTAQANEAIIASQIPQTAQVDRTKATFTPQIAGAPELKPVEGTPLSYVANSPIPLIQLPTGQWYALQKAVGYMGTYVAADGTVVYGTGYAYTPYIGTTVWYGPPVTYGYAAGLAWTPWTGWAIGFGMGWAYGVAWSGELRPVFVVNPSGRRAPEPHHFRRA